MRLDTRSDHWRQHKCGTCPLSSVSDFFIANYSQSTTLVSPHLQLLFTLKTNIPRYTYLCLPVTWYHQIASVAAGPMVVLLSKGSVDKPSKKYPCPLAQQFNCSDTFSNSSHASRHTKRHTGIKDARCLDCGKAFARSDTLKQHHQRAHHSYTNNKTAVRKPGKPQRKPSGMGSLPGLTRPSSISKPLYPRLSHIQRDSDQNNPIGRNLSPHRPLSELSLYLNAATVSASPPSPTHPTYNQPICSLADPLTDGSGNCLISTLPLTHATDNARHTFLSAYGDVVLV